ncbi:MAG: phytoene desaturase [Chitinophagaceae bacterium]|nr:MAG: phytoene desaturase [Chitinophagaceae bacterium]
MPLLARFFGSIRLFFHVFEKHDTPGGRARQFSTPSGYVFDMGPSWYWMHDIIENFFNDFGYQTSDFFRLVALDPQFEIIFQDEKLLLPKAYEDIKKLFENIEEGSGKKLDKFMRAAKYKYETGMYEFVNKPCNSWWEFVSVKIAKNALKLDMLTNFRTYAGKYFSDAKLKALMEFPVIFLGASPKEIPALYSLMNYGGYVLGTHYPMGGFNSLVLAMKTVAELSGATFHFNSNVERINVRNNQVSSLNINGKDLHFDAVIASADYHHSETLLSDKTLKNYNSSFWQKKTFAPSCLIYYLGINRRIPNLKHHTLFFENDLDEHTEDIYKKKRWPNKPLFYACCPSQTDPGVAPQGCENLFLLMPVATGLNDEDSIREKYLEQMITRLEKHTGISDLSASIEFKRSYCVKDFMMDYNAYGGNAYGLANTLRQTAVLKPKLRNRKINNLLYTG